MGKTVVATENALFEFERIDTPEPLLEDNDRIHIALDLIAAGKGSVTCKICGKTYRADELESFTVGHGKSPFELNLKKKGGVKSLFKGKQKLPAMFGGKGYRCPENHELISLITWQT